MARGGSGECGRGGGGGARLHGCWGGGAVWVNGREWQVERQWTDSEPRAKAAME